MRTELQVAKFNIKTWKREDADTFIRVYYYACEKLKGSCKRFLKFLNENLWSGEDLHQVEDMNEDLEQAIKLYEEAGI